jgi:hypothetical protein
MPKLEESIGLYDTCGVHNLHGMPGVLGGLASVITAGFATHALYGDNIGDVYTKMVGSDGRSAGEQVWIIKMMRPSHVNISLLFYGQIQIGMNLYGFINYLEKKKATTAKLAQSFVLIFLFILGCGSVVRLGCDFVHCNHFWNFHGQGHRSGN